MPNLDINSVIMPNLTDRQFYVQNIILLLCWTTIWISFFIYLEPDLFLHDYITAHGQQTEGIITGKGITSGKGGTAYNIYICFSDSQNSSHNDAYPAELLFYKKLQQGQKVPVYYLENYPRAFYIANIPHDYSGITWLLVMVLGFPIGLFLYGAYLRRDYYLNE